MNNKLKKLHLLELKYLLAYPSEIFICISFFILYLYHRIDLHLGFIEHGSIENLFFLFPILFFISISLNNLSHKFCRVLYKLSGLFFIPFLFFDWTANYFLSSSTFLVINFMAFLFFVLTRRADDDVSFIVRAVDVVVDLLSSLLVGGLVVFALFILSFSFDYLFKVDTFSQLQDLYNAFAGFVIVPFVFIRRDLYSANDTELHVPYFIEFVVNYIFSPALIIYAFYLYLCFLLFASSGMLPDAGIAVSVLVFMLCYLFGKMLQKVMSRPLFRWFYKNFSIISIVPLILFWVDIYQRIVSFGLTESTVYLAISCLLLTAYVFAFIFYKKISFRLIYFSMLLTFFAFTVVPFVNASFIGEMAQRIRLEKYAKQLNLWQSSDQPLLSSENIPQDSVAQLQYYEMYAAYLYLDLKTSFDVVERYGKLSEPVDKSNSFCLVHGLELCNTQGYPYYYNFNYGSKIVGKEKDGVIRVTLENDSIKKLLLEFNVKDAINKNVKSKDDLKTKLATFAKAKNDSCLLFLNSISLDQRKDKTYEIRDISFEAFFMNKPINELVNE